MRHALLFNLLRSMVVAVAVSMGVATSVTSAVHAAPTFSVPASELADPLVLVAYGDMRFTGAAETGASNPNARRTLVAKIAAERPAAIFINGDVPWHGVAPDYDVYREETRPWADAHARVYPALGNHEFSRCSEADCLELWWKAFPALRDRRWYSVALGTRVVGIALDSDTSLLPGSPQRIWLEAQVAELAPQVRLVLIVMHHPPVADVQTTKLVDHNPRPNEIALADYLKTVAPRSSARFVVSAGHIHNYERFAQDGVVYLVSGGGGATPYEVDRGPGDLYQNPDFPNYHYVRVEIRARNAAFEMIRLADYDAAEPHHWQVRDRFEVSLRP
jgi:hypothetical protein